jgi:HD-like signal output (HDOD) protein
VMDMRTFWRHSVHCGVLARLIATHCNTLDAERLFVAGLLRDISHVILYQRMPKASQELLMQARQQRRLLFTLERERFGCDYAQIGGELLRAWKLPVALESAVSFHTRPGRAQQFSFEAAIVHLASIVTESLQWYGGNESWQECADTCVWQLTNQSVEAIERLFPEAQDQVAATMELIFPNLRQAC